MWKSGVCVTVPASGSQLPGAQPSVPVSNVAIGTAAVGSGFTVTESGRPRWTVRPAASRIV